MWRTSAYIHNRKIRRAGLVFAVLPVTAFKFSLLCVHGDLFMKEEHHSEVWDGACYEDVVV